MTLQVQWYAMGYVWGQRNVGGNNWDEVVDKEEDYYGAIIVIVILLLPINK